MSAAYEISSSPHVSVSSITTYLRCPRQWEHHYLLRTPPAHRSGALAFGAAIHEALGLFYSGLRDDEEPSPWAMAVAFSEAWSRELDGGAPVLLDDGDTPDDLRDEGLTMLGVFLEKVPRPERVLAVEQDFVVALHDPETGVLLPPLVGRLDAVVERGGAVHVLEHKTAARRYTEDRLRHDLQPTAYGLAARTMGYDATVTFQLLLKTKTPALELYDVSRTDQDRQDFVETVVGVTRAIEAGAFYPVRDWWCRGCPYAGPCLAG